VRAGTAPGEDYGKPRRTDADLSLEQPAHLSVSPALFQKFQKLIYAETGIWLGGAKTALLCGRLFRRLRALQMDSLASYYECVSAPEADDERACMIDAITTNETRFFREPRQFDFLVQRVIPRWQREADGGMRPRRLRIWSAGCSSGEEPYTIAMLLARHVPVEAGWDVRILATDISNRVLDKAIKGVYPINRLSEIPPDLLHAFMLRGVAARQGEMKVRVEIQQMVTFQRLNLDRETDLVQGPFDAIFCRNVLIYFDAASKQRVITNLYGRLMNLGLLFVGHAENLSNMSLPLRCAEPSIYVKTEDKGNSL
jgi:chemotaxis protein methyltransferase CheR